MQLSRAHVRNGKNRSRWRATVLIICLVVVGTGGFVLDEMVQVRAPAKPGKKVLAVHPKPITKTSPSLAGSKTTSQLVLPKQVLIKVPAQSQLPQLKNGCEVTTLSMLLAAVGHPINKMVLAKEEPLDPTKLVMDSKGNIQYWGNPNVGFVGSISGYGYGIYHGPMTKFINKLLPGSAKDLTGDSFSSIMAEVAKGHPVMVWTTATFQPTTLWQTWDSPEGSVRATMEEHAVLLVGWNGQHLLVNDPLTGVAAEAVDLKPFVAAWEQLGKQAVTFIPQDTMARPESY